MTGTGTDGRDDAHRHALAFADVPFRGIVEQSLAGIYVVLDERFMYANDTFAAMFGYEREEFIGRRMVDCVTEDSAEEVMRNYRRRMNGEIVAVHYLTKGVRKDGGIVHLELHASRVECRGRPALAGVALDVTERVQAQAALQRSHEQLRALARRISEAREQERSRLSRDVHDLLGGMLSAAKFDLARIVRRTDVAGLEELHGIASALLAATQETIDTARSISAELRPVTLDLEGLGPALRQALERFEQRFGIEAVAKIPDAPVSLGHDVATQLYRIVQEALTNVARHSGARHVVLELAQDETGLTLSLSDDGQGIDPSSIRHDAIGLLSMRERAGDVGAKLDVVPGPAGGTSVVLHLPGGQRSRGSPGAPA
jgi:PAS domain S-box-containing protein